MQRERNTTTSPSSLPQCNQSSMQLIGYTSLALYTIMYDCRSVTQNSLREISVKKALTHILKRLTAGQCQHGLAAVHCTPACHAPQYPNPRILHSASVTRRRVVISIPPFLTLFLYTLSPLPLFPSLPLSLSPSSSLCLFPLPSSLSLSPLHPTYPYTLLCVPTQCRLWVQSTSITTITSFIIFLHNLRVLVTANDLILSNPVFLLVQL